MAAGGCSTGIGSWADRRLPSRIERGDRLGAGCHRGDRPNENRDVGDGELRRPAVEEVGIQRQWHQGALVRQGCQMIARWKTYKRSEPCHVSPVRCRADRDSGLERGMDLGFKAGNPIPGLQYAVDIILEHYLLHRVIKLPFLEPTKVRLRPAAGAGPDALGHGETVMQTGVCAPPI